MELAFLGSPPDLLIVFVVALVFLGPKKLPEVGRQIGQALREFRKVTDEVTGAAHSVRSEIESAVHPLTKDQPTVAARPKQALASEPGPAAEPLAPDARFVEPAAAENLAAEPVATEKG